VGRASTIGLALAALACLATAAVAQDAPEVEAPVPEVAPEPALEDRIRRLRSGIVRLEYRYDDPELLQMRRAISWVETEAHRIESGLEAHLASRPALTRLSQGEVLHDAWFVLHTAELVGVPPHVERPMRSALGRRIEPLRCEAIARYFAAARLGGGTSVGYVARDRLAEHGMRVIRRCWEREPAPAVTPTARML